MDLIVSFGYDISLIILLFVELTQQLSLRHYIYNVSWILVTVGLINFEDKKFRGFRGYLLNLEIKYPCNFLYTRSKFFIQHVHVVGK